MKGIMVFRALKNQRDYLFEPRDDITAFELARILAQVQPGMGRLLDRVTVEGYDEIPADLLRHFRLVRDSRKELEEQYG